MAALSTIATMATVAGTVVSAAGTLAAGKAAQDAANFEAAQLDIAAKEERAAGQREMLEQRRKKNLALSALQARSAASGFTATDPTALDLTGEIASYGTYQEQLAQYGGKSRAAGRKAQATGARMTGRAKRIGSYFDAGGTILGGISSMARFSSPRGYG